jgi:hypothetical protein
MSTNPPQRLITEPLDPDTAAIYNAVADLEEREARSDARWRYVGELINWFPIVALAMWIVWAVAG